MDVCSLRDIFAFPVTRKLLGNQTTRAESAQFVPRWGWFPLTDNAPFIRRNPARARRTLKLEMGPDGVLIRSRVGVGYCYRLLVEANLVLIPATVNGRGRMSNLATFR
jgi:hypothetical protein